MLNTESRRSPKNKPAKQTPPVAPKKSKLTPRQFTAKELQEALEPLYDLGFPLDGLISTAEAAFEFIRMSELDLTARNSFFQLERQFVFYKTLVELKR